MAEPHPVRTPIPLSAANRYTLYGAVFGAAFPLLGTLLTAYLEFGSVGAAELVAAQRSSPLLWIIDTAPFWLGLFARAAGIQQNRLEGVHQRFSDRERRFRSIIENASDVITILAPDGAVLYETPSIAQVLGYSPEERVGTDGFAPVHPDDVAAAREVFQRWLGQPDAIQPTRCRFRHRDGRWRVLEITGRSHLEDPAVMGMVLSSRDVTERQQAEGANRRLAAIIESSDDAIFSNTLDGTVLTWNPGAERIYGYTAAEMVGRSVGLLVPPELPNDQVGILERIRCGGPVERRETRRLTRERRRIDVALSIAPIHNAAGEVIATSTIARDMSEQKQAEHRLRSAKEAAEAANRSKSEFLSSISHELRTPLNSVIGFANVIGKNKVGNLREQDLQYLDRIRSNGKHLLELINDILDLSKIEAGKLELEVAPVALDELARDTVETLRGALRPGVALHAVIPEELAAVSTDAGRLRQVLINLLGNALKFTEQGSVTLTVRADEAGTPLRIDVQDTGIGIPADRLAAIFQPFEQAEGGTARRFGGTGLGLTISASLCELLGYRLEVRSDQGVGSTFSILLDGAAQATALPDRTHPAVEPVQELPPPGPGISLEDRLVLIIDDEADSHLLLSHHLEEFGCRIVSASTGEQGLRIARECRPDVITLDLLLPGMSGPEVLRALRADAETARIPVVVVSVVAGENRGGVLGRVDVLDKPIDRDALRDALLRNLGARIRRVLMVDDEPDARRLLAACVEAEGMEIRGATSQWEALRVIREFSPELIVLDLLMPDRGGIELLHALRDDDQYRRIPVVVVTAQSAVRGRGSQPRP